MKKENTKRDKIILYLLLVISLFSFIIITQSIKSNNFLSVIDKKINILSSNIHSDLLVSISKTISNIFDPVVFALLFTIVITFLFYKKRKSEAASLTILTAISFSFNQILKIIFSRTRPINALINESNFSFPSGHALMSIIFFGALIYLFEQHIKSRKSKLILTAISVLLVLLISASRILLNVHWFSDILGSLALGIFILICYTILARKTLFNKN